MKRVNFAVVIAAFLRPGSPTASLKGEVWILYQRTVNACGKLYDLTHQGRRSVRQGDMNIHEPADTGIQNRGSRHPDNSADIPYGQQSVFIDLRQVGCHSIHIRYLPGNLPIAGLSVHLGLHLKLAFCNRQSVDSALGRNRNSIH